MASLQVWQVAPFADGTLPPEQAVHTFKAVHSVQSAIPVQSVHPVPAPSTNLPAPQSVQVSGVVVASFL